MVAVQGVMPMKQKTYSGYGMPKFLDTCYKHKLNDKNSTVYIKDKTDLNSYWCVKLKKD